MSNTDKPSVRFFTSAIGVVLTINRSKSECSAREIQIVGPRMTYLSPLRTAIVFNCVVSDPVVGSLTPKAWSRNCPPAMFGRYARFCSSDPWRSNVPIVYMSVRWWRTIHQIQSSPATVDPAYVIGLRLNAFAFLFVMIWFIRRRYEAAMLERAAEHAAESTALGGRVDA